LGLLGVARAAFERGLAINAAHPLVLGKLTEVLLALGDWHAAAHVVRWTLRHEPRHPRALALQGALGRLSEGRSELARPGDLGSRTCPCLFLASLLFLFRRGIDDRVSLHELRETLRR
jgi:hypothetical protein